MRCAIETIAHEDRSGILDHSLAPGIPPPRDLRTASLTSRASRRNCAPSSIASSCFAHGFSEGRHARVQIHTQREGGGGEREVEKETERHSIYM